MQVQNQVVYIKQVKKRRIWKGFVLKIGYFRQVRVLVMDVRTQEKQEDSYWDTEAANTKDETIDVGEKKYLVQE